MLTVGLGQAWFPAWKTYKEKFEQAGVKVILLDFFRPGWAQRLKKIDKKINFYFWHADTWEENYRRIHDRIFFIEKFLKKPVFPDFNQYFSYNDKLKQKEIFDYLKLPQVPTYVAIDLKEALSLLTQITYPIVIKNAYSACGMGIYKINSRTQAEQIVRKIFSPQGWHHIQGYLYLQKFIPSLKADLRIITIGSRVAAAYWRQALHGWKHNISQGAKANFNHIPLKAKNFCLKISRRLNFHWMAYDLIMVKDKIKLLEWTCNFGCKACQEINLDIRGQIAKYVLDYYYKHLQKYDPKKN